MANEFDALENMLNDDTTKIPQKVTQLQGEFKTLKEKREEILALKGGLEASYNIQSDAEARAKLEASIRGYDKDIKEIEEKMNATGTQIVQLTGEASYAAKIKDYFTKKLKSAVEDLKKPKPTEEKKEKFDPYEIGLPEWVKGSNTATIFGAVKSRVRKAANYLSKIAKMYPGLSLEEFKAKINNDYVLKNSVKSSRELIQKAFKYAKDLGQDYEMKLWKTLQKPSLRERVKGLYNKDRYDLVYQKVGPEQSTLDAFD